MILINLSINKELIDFEFVGIGQILIFSLFGNSPIAQILIFLPFRNSPIAQILIFLPFRNSP
ncbi:MAG: hypothetical protein WCL14_14460, partial [Bacteroidota bacterium]